MLPCSALLARIGPLLASDVLLLHFPTDFPKLHLIIAPFTESEGIDPATLTLATSGGLAAIVAAVGPHQESIDPATGEILVRVKPPVGGWVHELSATPDEDIIIYGYILTDNAGEVAILVHEYAEDDRVTLNLANQSHLVPEVAFRLPVDQAN